MRYPYHETLEIHPRGACVQQPGTIRWVPAKTKKAAPPSIKESGPMGHLLVLVLVLAGDCLPCTFFDGP